MNNTIYDMVIVGGGPAGLSSAIYMARANYKTLIIEKEKFGGQITITSEVVNYPGVFHTSGAELTSQMQKQAEHFGAEFKLCELLEIDVSNEIKVLKTTSGEIKTLGVILALGASPRKIGFDGENEYQGRGVAYCATCDGEFFTNMPVYVVGGGFAAVEEAIFLTKYASNIQMIVRKENFACAQSIVDHLKDHEKITVNFNTEVVSVAGDTTLKTITLKNNKTNEVTTTEYEKGFGVFVFAGYVPNTSWLGDTIATRDGYIITDENQKTNIDGIYAAGDVCIKDLRQVVTAVSDGAIAATSAEKYVAALHTKLGLPQFEVAAAKHTTKDTEVKRTSHAEDNNDEAFISNEMKEQLISIFAKFTNTVIISAALDNSDLAKELSSFIDEMTGISDKVRCKKTTTQPDDLGPYLEILTEDEVPSGIRFYAMPGGHEFNSFILALYNVAGPGKEIAPEDEARIKSISKKTDIKVLISLSCTMCPEVVTGTGKIASLNKNITASTVDIVLFPELKEKYNVMSVPCMIVNDSIINFGKKNIGQILDILESI